MTQPDIAPIWPAIGESVPIQHGCRHHVRLERAGAKRSMTQDNALPLLVGVQKPNAHQEKRCRNSHSPGRPADLCARLQFSEGKW